MLIGTRISIAARRTIALAGLALIFGAVFVPGASAQTGQETVYSITIVRDLDEVKARDYKIQLESLGFIPVVLEFQGDRATVLYGAFPDQASAVRAKGRLGAEGFTSERIVRRTRGGSAPAAGAAPSVIYRVTVQKFFDAREAQRLKQGLERKTGLFDVEAVAVPDGVEIRVGKFTDRNSAQNMLALLRDQGYTTARIVEFDTRQAIGSAPTATGAPATGPIVSAAITQTDLWQSLDSDQKRQVIDTVMMQEQISSGNVVAEKLLAMERRLDKLDDRTKEVFDMVTSERAEQARKTTEVAQLFRDANNLASGKRYEDAIIKLRAVLKIDPRNQMAVSRIRGLERFNRGEMYEGQRAEIEVKYNRLKDDAKGVDVNSLGSLTTAISTWNVIKQLDPEKYGLEADNKISEYQGSIARISEERALADKAADEKRQKFVMGLFAALGAAFLLIVVSSLRGRKRHRELRAMISEITAGGLRPPRELEAAGAGGGMLTSGATAIADPPADKTESDVFAPTTSGEPPADTSPDTTTVEETSATGDLGTADDVFGDVGATDESSPDESVGATAGIPSKDISGGGDSVSDIDDIFSELGSSGGIDPVDSAPAPAAEESSSDTSFDDIFSDIPAASEDSATGGLESLDDDTGFSMDDIFGTDTESVVADSKPKITDPEGTSDIPSISFDDISSDKIESKPEAPSDEGDDEGRISLFDESADEDQSDAPTMMGSLDGPASESGDSTEFESLFGSDTSTEPPPAEGLMAGGDTTRPTPVADDSEIPAIKLDVPDEDPFADIGGVHASETKTGDSGLGSIDLSSAAPQPKVSDGSSTTAIPAGAELGAAGFAQNFEDDPVGQAPAGWTGSYDYATLTVRDDSPPEGASHYMAYVKKEGAGKAYFSTKFPNVDGVVSIEFDLCCNDKNKFLLGFYLEKDEDFQQSVHTKILRSEAQTAPTIHLQGEPAPYLLGSWAHIKYIVDLNAGKVDGYIDGTHIARGLKLPQTPKYFNTLAIRDNINTTGELLIGNITVEKIS